MSIIDEREIRKERKRINRKSGFSSASVVVLLLYFLGLTKNSCYYT